MLVTDKLLLLGIKFIKSPFGSSNPQYTLTIQPQRYNTVIAEAIMILGIVLGVLRRVGRADHQQRAPDRDRGAEPGAGIAAQLIRHLTRPV